MAYWTVKLANYHNFKGVSSKLQHFWEEKIVLGKKRQLRIARPDVAVKLFQ